MDSLHDLEAFVAVVEQGSQTAAARHLRRTLQSIGRSLAGLEGGIGVTLIQRTTRRSRPTEAGQAFYERVRPALAQIDEARAEAADLGRRLTGRLRVGAPVLLARAFVVPAICDLLGRFPLVDVELKASDQAVDLLAEGLDVAVRVRSLPDSSLKARQIGSLRVVAFASPGYLHRHGRPAHPDELVAHACLVRSIDGADEPWEFLVDGARRNIRVVGPFRSNDTPAILAAAQRGLGIGYAPRWQIGAALASGAVETVLDAFEPPPLPVHAVFPPTRTRPQKVRRFIEFLGARLELAVAQPGR